MHYIFEFKEEDNIIVASFKTISNTEYRVYFYPSQEYLTSINTNANIFKNAYFFGFTKPFPNEKKIEPIDFEIRNTVVEIINQFF